MLYNRLVLVLMLALGPTLCHAQQTTTTTHTTSTTHKKHHTTKHPLPTWAAAHNYDATSHAYFPDYHAFYDANRGGYVFLENGKWSFTPAEPPYMQNADLGKARVQILKGLNLDLRPELDYPKYMKLYPAVQGADGNDVVSPTPLPYSGNQ